MSSTEGSGGGPPLVMSKEPVERPEIPRGRMTTFRRANEEVEPLRPFTFNARLGMFRLTYHNVRVEQVNDLSITVFITDLDVVTWEKVAAE